jgi:hypothetical protein
MKQLFLTLIISVFLGFCTPRNRELPAKYGGRINITARIINPQDSIGINDTVKIQFESLDTIVYNGINTHVMYSNHDYAYTDIILHKIDNSYAGSQGPASGSLIFTPTGRLDASKHVLTFQNNGNSLKGEYDIIPKFPGVYFFDQILPGFLSADNGDYQLDTYWNYGSINRNHQMLIDSAGPTANFSLFLQDRLNHGLEVYGFKVK